MIKVDIAIFGGGIAGLWTLARLTKLGYNTVLFETDALGSGQTIKSQGIIHGGLKYALTGNLSSAATALQDMPTTWQQCLDGSGELDLSATRTLARSQHMWSINKLTGGITTLFASNALKGQVDVEEKSAWPQVLVESAIQTKLYKLSELVLDIPSLIKALATPYLNRCIKLDNPESFMFELDGHENIQYVTFKTGPLTFQLSAQKFIFTAGSGNANLTHKFTTPTPMQLRPLQMVVVKAKNLMPIYGHCVGLGTVPRVTITTHTANDHTPVWYLGGKIAEDGVHRTQEQQIACAKTELTELFPKLDLNAAEFASFFVDRAEAKQSDGSKPNSATMFNVNNHITAWPTKLAMAPVLTQQIVEQLNTENITPKFPTVATFENFPQPEFATPIWDQLL
jgi:hypothetical protein